MTMSNAPAPAAMQSLPVLLRPDEQRRTAHEFVLDTLRRAILSGKLPGGTRLVQSEIAAQLNVSTTPVREALRDLAADELIRFDPHRGGIVTTIDAEEFQEIYQIRMLLEPLALRRTAERIGDAELEAAEAMAAEMERETDPGAWAEMNWRFHRLLVQGARSARLGGIVKSVQDSAALYVARSLQHTPTRIQQGNLEHRALLDALQHRDAGTTAKVMAQHLEGTLAAFSEAARHEGATSPDEPEEPQGDASKRRAGDGEARRPMKRPRKGTPES
jgi:DNA-binding GntR family transcriptional regulator